MPLKVYSKQQKEEIKNQLLETALDMYSKYGIRKVTLMDVLKAVGISKPFFYTFYDSVQVFVINVIEYQWIKFPDLLDDIEKKYATCWENRVHAALITFTRYRENGLLIMTQEEEVWVRSRLDENRYVTFMDNQYCFFEDLLKRWDIPDGKCNPKVLANMLLSMILTHNSARRSLPFLYLDDLDETAEVHAKSMIVYLKTLKD